MQCSLEVDYILQYHDCYQQTSHRATCPSCRLVLPRAGQWLRQSHRHASLFSIFNSSPPQRDTALSEGALRRVEFLILIHPRRPVKQSRPPQFHPASSIVVYSAHRSSCALYSQRRAYLRCNVMNRGTLELSSQCNDCRTESPALGLF